MSTTTITMTPTSLTTGRVGRSPEKPTKVVILKIPGTMLKKWQAKHSPLTENDAAAEPSPESTTLAVQDKHDKQDTNSEAPATPGPSQDVASDTKAASVNGAKRSTPMPSDNSSKPRGKPGPKKKPRLDDGTIDHANKPVANTANVIPNSKLGPKANTGFINANLRALDRSGAPCRRWQKGGFQLKSFTGVTWNLSSWKGSADSSLTNGTSDSSTKDISMEGSSNHKPSESDTAAGSNAGDRPDRMEISTPAASSPPPPPSSLPAAAAPVSVQS